MEHNHPTLARPDVASDPGSVPPVGPLTTSDSVEPEPDDDAFAYPAPETYDLDEYRWVPVRRRPRVDGWTEEKQRRFIEALADTGLVSYAAKAVGMSRESANRLRRSPHGAAFANAWDVARKHAGSALEDIAFERAIEGQEQHIYNEYGDIVVTKRVINDRMLTFLLSHLMPERYGKAARAAGDRDGAPTDALPPPVALEASLRAMEPQLPAPPEELFDPETLAIDLLTADIADGKLPHFYNEQRPPKSDEQLKAEEIAAREARGKVANEKMDNGDRNLSQEEFSDLCHYLDPTLRLDRGRKRYR